MQNQSLGITFLLVLAAVFFLLINKIPDFAFESAEVIPCEQPLTYRIGSIDPEFDITKSELRNLMEEVEKLWQTAIEQEVLRHSEVGSVVIHLIYSEEQKRTDNEKQFSQRINTIKQQVASLENEYQRLAQNYKRKQKDLQKSVSEYHQAVEEYNTTVKAWNSKGGIPPDKKEAIKAKKRQVEKLEAEVRRKETNTEAVRQQVNARSSQLNELIKRQNTLIARYNKEFGEPRKFDQGQYIRQGDDERINIYQFGNWAELKTVLAHESGHAMGLDHVDNPRSLMNAVMDKQDIFNLALTDEDIQALKQRCEK